MEKIRGRAMSFGRAGALSLLAFSFIAAPVTAQESATAGAAVDPKPIHFTDDIHPILTRSCFKCHANGADKGGFNVESRERMLAGGDSGASIVLGDPDASLMVQMIEGKVEGKIMPLKGPRLTPDEINLVRRWIREGMAWDEEIKPAAKAARPIAPLAPRRPEIPVPAWWARSASPVDLILMKYWSDRGVEPPQPVSDAVFARRVWVDILGVIPTPEEVAAFAADPAWDRRERLVEKLLANRRAYAENFMTFWNDMLRNDFSGTGYIDGGRTQITDWLFKSLASNKPYDQFVRELIDPTPESAGFIKGIVWRGVVNSSQTPAMQAAQNLSQVFMGTNLKCASCHDSFINQWKLKDSYGLASIFSEDKLEINRCDSPTGEMAVMKFLYPELGEIDPAAPREERLKKLAGLMTRPENGRIARTLVNRLWARFMGRGLVEPLDDMDRDPWSAELIDWLATDFVDHGWDVQHLIRMIVTSMAYQAPSVALPEQETSEFVFRGPGVRRLSGEQMLDALARLTGASPGAPESRMNLAAVEPDWPARRDAISQRLKSAEWIWSRPGAAISAPAEKAWFRKVVHLDGIERSPIREALLLVGADNNFKVLVNGKEVGKGKNWDDPQWINLAPALIEGQNVIAIEAENTAEGPAGLVAVGWIKRAEADADVDLSTNATWLSTRHSFRAWQGSAPAGAEFWGYAQRQGDVAVKPWNIQGRLINVIAAREDQATRPTRAWLTKADALQRALGRPNRDQVVTRRASAATTLQALELTNGPILTDLVRRGAERIAEKQKAADPRRITETLWENALGRKPAENELQIATGLMQNPPTAQNVEDLLWALLNHPEFQLIR